MSNNGPKRSLIRAGRFLAVAMLLVVTPRVVQAAVTTVKTAPREVTVFPRAARVVRMGEVHLEAGQQVVRFTNIPAQAGDASIRLSAKGPRGTKLFGVQLNRAHAVETVQEAIRKLQEQIQAREDQKMDLNDKNTARKAEMEILKSLAKETAQQTKSQSSQRPGDLAKLAQGTKSVGQRIATLLAESRLDERGQRALEKKISVLRRKLQQMGQGSRAQKVAEAELELPQAGTVHFTLSYMLRRVGWTPLYELRLEPDQDNPKMALAFSAQVQQSTAATEIRRRLATLLMA